MVNPRTAFTGLGCLDTLVSVDRPFYVAGADGTLTTTWELFGERWAQVIQTGADEIEIGGVLTMTSRYLLRFLEDERIKASFRVRLPRGEVIQLTSVRAWGPCTECEGQATPSVDSAE